MTKIICVSLTYYSSTTINGHSTNCAIDYSIPGFQLKLGETYDATDPEYNKDNYFYIEANKTSYPKSLFRIVSELREEQIDSILND